MRTIAIHYGTDYDYSVSYIEVPDDLDLDLIYAKYNEWYDQEYIPHLDEYNRTIFQIPNCGKPQFYTFASFLKKFYNSEDSDVEIFHDKG